LDTLSDAGTLGVGRSSETRLILGFKSTRSVKTSAWRRSSPAVIGGWLAIVDITVTCTLRRWTASTKERKSPSPENYTI
jgi:hypothetical protein